MDYTNNILKRASFEFEGVSIRYVINSNGGEMWFCLSDVLKGAMRIADWFNKDSAISKFPNKKKVNFSDKKYHQPIYGASLNDVVEYLTDLSNTNTLKGDRASRFLEAINRIAKHESGIASTVKPVVAEITVDETESSEIVFKNESGMPVTTSLLIAKTFDKNHKDVLKDIKSLKCSDLFRERNFSLSYYTSLQNKKLPMYYISKDGFTFLVMGYSGEKAANFKEQYINAFNKMESALKQQISLPNFKDPAEAAIAWAEQYKARALAEKQIEEDRDKVDYYNRMIENRDYFTISSIASELNVTAAFLNNFLVENTTFFTKKLMKNIIVADHDHRDWQVNVPYYIKNKKGKEILLTHYVRWSKKGREEILKLYQAKQK